MNNKKVVIIKAGGSSIGSLYDSEKIKEKHSKIYEIINNYSSKGYKVIIVNSALKGFTRALIASSFHKEGTAEYHENLAIGELSTANLLNNNLKAMEIESALMNEQQFQHPVNLKKNGNGLEILNVNTQDIYRVLESGYVPIIPGFIGRIHGRWGTISLDGSDISAIEIGIALKESKFYGIVEVVLLKDYAIYNKDPKEKDAKHLPKLHWDEAIALTEVCGDFVHPKGIQKAQASALNINILTFEGETSIIGN
ncbi:MAG: hypothetical protein N4A44_00110 [Alphaproteobacteria bacterium]|jgi:aspartokinase|nr:hypothetical protein [Alphaproteobacteria bacterium]